MRVLGELTIFSRRQLEASSCLMFEGTFTTRSIALWLRRRSAREKEKLEDEGAEGSR